MTHHHELKILPEYFQAHIDGKKDFELRFCGDRDFQVNQIVKLVEVKGSERVPTGRYLKVRITFILEDFPGLERDYCILGTKFLLAHASSESLRLLHNA